MYSRTIISLILITFMTFPASSRTRLQADNGQDQDRTVPPYDRYEALKIARIFKEELEKSNDIAPLVDKYFVGDFYERFAREAAEKFELPVKPTALAVADKADVRRYYVALTNFEFLLFRLHFTLEKQVEERITAEGGQADDAVNELGKLFPKDVIDAFRSNPHLSGLIPRDDSDEPTTSIEPANPPNKSTTSESGTGSDKLEHEIGTLEQLDELSSAMEIAAARMRDYLKSLPANKIALDYLMPNEDDSETPQLSYAVSETVYITDQDTFYGVPKDTTLVCACVFNLHIDMLRVDGELKVLTVYMQVGD